MISLPNCRVLYDVCEKRHGAGEKGHHAGEKGHGAREKRAWRRAMLKLARGKANWGLLFK